MVLVKKMKRGAEAMKFQWNDGINRVLCLGVKMNLECCDLEGNKIRFGRIVGKFVLDAEMQLWPQGASQVSA